MSGPGGSAELRRTSACPRPPQQDGNPLSVLPRRLVGVSDTDAPTQQHGNLGRSPRETEARSLRDYLLNRARYQLTQRGELVHRQIEELLSYSERARGLQRDARWHPAGLAALSPWVSASATPNQYANSSRSDYYSHGE